MIELRGTLPRVTRLSGIADLELEVAVIPRRPLSPITSAMR
jgi:hypothetical protein